MSTFIIGENHAKDNELTSPIVAVQAENDLVTVIRPREYPHPEREGETYTTTWYDTWRIVDGKADEHWDSATMAAPGEE